MKADDPLNGVKPTHALIAALIVASPTIIAVGAVVSFAVYGALHLGGLVR